MTPAERDRFDALVEDALEALPPRVRSLLDEVPLVVLDEPTPEMLRDLGMRPGEEEELCGLHTGVENTRRTVEASGELPSQIHLFRRGIVAAAGGWRQRRADDRIYDEIMTTLLHEIGHQMGLDEDDLERLGYG